MEKQKEKIRSFTGLRAWQESHKLTLLIYETTKNFPPEEQFGLVSQLRRAVVSITSNIAEGFSRQSLKEKINFYFTALGSLTEVQNQIIIARDVKYIAKEKFDNLAMQTISVSKTINGLIKSIKSFSSNI